MIGFLNSFVVACDSDGIHEGAVIWVFLLLHKKASIRCAHHEIRVWARSLEQDAISWNGHNHDELSTGCQLITIQLFYGREYRQMDEYVIISTQLQGKAPSQYGEELVKNAFSFAHDYDEHDFIDNFIKWLHQSIPQSMRVYWASRKTASG